MFLGNASPFSHSDIKQNTSCIFPGKPCSAPLQNPSAHATKMVTSAGRNGGVSVHVVPAGASLSSPIVGRCMSHAQQQQNRNLVHSGQDHQALLRTRTRHCIAHTSIPTSAHVYRHTNLEGSGPELGGMVVDSWEQPVRREQLQPSFQDMFPDMEPLTNAVGTQPPHDAQVRGLCARKTLRIHALSSKANHELLLAYARRTRGACPPRVLLY